LSWRGWTRLVTFEREFQLRIRDLLKNAIEKYQFDGVELASVTTEWVIDNRRADIVVELSEGKPLFIMELKRKTESATRASTLSRATDRALIGQALSYVYLAKKKGIEIPFIITANPKEIAIFEVPEDLEEYIDPKAVSERDFRHVVKFGKFWEIIENFGLIYEKLVLSEEYFIKILDMLTGIYIKKYRAEEKRAPLSYRTIEFFRDFVNWLSDNIMDLIKTEYETTLKEDLEKLEERLGYKPSSEQLAREMTYIFMNKIIFYRVLERYYKGLDELKPLTDLGITRSADYLRTLSEFFRKAIEITGDFEPIFITGIYDKIKLPDDLDILLGIDEFIDVLDEFSIEKLGDVIGYIYEELIPPDERHQLGQFYTPPAVAELITKWAIRDGNEIVLDPGCGSGTFLIESYKRFVKLKTGKDLKLIRKIKPEIHERILEQLYGIDINEFPAHLSAINLAMRNPRAPSARLKIIKDDFFNISRGLRRFSPYKIKTPEGEKQAEIKIPEKFDVVVGNPPYTRWVEIPEKTQQHINQEIGEDLTKYKLRAQVSRGIEPGIYIHFIIHATKFLKNGGRLGMIISNLWLQTDYGIKFANFLLDHYKIHAIIDFTLRLFNALISTCVILLEKEEDEAKRNENEVLFIRIPGEVDRIEVDELLKTLGSKKSNKYFVRIIEQKNISREDKWIKYFFVDVENIFKHSLFIKLGEIFEISRGNTRWALWALRHGKRPDPGSSMFFYLKPSDAKEKLLLKYAYPNMPLEKAILYPAITSARDVKYFTFTESDWRELLKKDKRCFMFICHKPKNKLPKPVKKYIKLGETEIRTRIRGSRKGGRLANETEAAKVREKYKEHFYGWYDLGGILYTPIIAVYQAWWKNRFSKLEFPVATYHALITLIPKKRTMFTENQLNALLAFLNSTLTQYYIEIYGRRSGGGIIGLEVNIAKEMPILDVKKLNTDQINSLANLFLKLDSEARRVGGANTKMQIDKLKSIIFQIDDLLGRILKIPKDYIKKIEDQVDELISRRVMASEEARPGAIKGEEIKILVKKKKIKRKKKVREHMSLDFFVTEKTNNS